MAVDMDKLNDFIGRFVGDLGAAVHTGMVVIGEKLGLYKALAQGPMTSAELAAKTKTDERYLHEWLSSQAAGGYVTYDASTHKFSLNAEQAFTLADESSPAYLPERSSWHWARCRQSRVLRNHSAPALEWDGMSMLTACFTAARSSFVLGTRPIW